jgi:hypothetical protein
MVLHNRAAVSVDRSMFIHRHLFTGGALPHLLMLYLRSPLSFPLLCLPFHTSDVPIHASAL